MEERQLQPLKRIDKVEWEISKDNKKDMKVRIVLIDTSQGSVRPEVIYRGIKESYTGKRGAALLPFLCSWFYLAYLPEEHQSVMVESIEPKDGDTDCSEHSQNPKSDGVRHAVGGSGVYRQPDQGN